jgi:hypothetical protein
MQQCVLGWKCPDVHIPSLTEAAPDVGTSRSAALRVLDAEHNSLHRATSRDVLTPLFARASYSRLTATGRPSRPVTTSGRTAVLAAHIDFAVDDKLAEAAIEELQIYQWSKPGPNPDGARLRPDVSEMQRVVEKTINRRAKH